MVAARTPNHTRSPKARGSAAAAKQSTSRGALTAPVPGRWQSKLRAGMPPQVVEDRRGAGRLLLPTPLLVAEAVAAIPPGRVLTMRQLREALARRFEADRTCPLMTGVSATVLAGAVAEDLGRGAAARWPIWRLVRDDGTLHPKWPLDPRYRATLLRQEGVPMTRRHGHWAVMDTQHC